jgi:glycosyltransferase involved in cell wall biosynthesis
MEIRIALLIQSYGRFGGAERAALLHFNRLRRLGKDVELFADFADGNLWARDELSVTNFNHLPRSFYEPESLRLLHRLDDYDRILVHHHIEPIFAYRLTKNLWKKTAWYSGSIFEPAYSELLHGEDYRKVSLSFEATTKSFYGNGLGTIGLALFPISKKILRVLDFQTVTRYRKIISNSKYQAKYLKNVYGVDSAVVYPPVESGLLSAEKLPVEIEKPYVLMVGAFVPYKNFENGIRAMYPLRQDYDLAMVGTGILKDQYRRIAESVGVKLHIYYGSNDSIMHSLYSSASFLIHPSLFEGFGYIPAEAALHKRATILTTRSGVRELLSDGKSSYFCDPSDIETMKKRAKHLAEHPEKSEDMGKNAHDAIKKLCTTEQTLELWEELEGWED